MRCRARSNTKPTRVCLFRLSGWMTHVFLVTFSGCLARIFFWGHAPWRRRANNPRLRRYPCFLHRVKKRVPAGVRVVFKALHQLQKYFERVYSGGIRHMGCRKRQGKLLLPGMRFLQYRLILCPMIDWQTGNVSMISWGRQRTFSGSNFATYCKDCKGWMPNFEACVVLMR